ncbi:hypothetical protein EGW08_020005, partial [Elysia chlorotica]
MPKARSKVYTPTNGVRTDFKRLMDMFLSSATVRFEHFSEVWRSLNMSYLCAGRNSDREAREFVEKVLIIAREYFLPPYQFQARVGGLYLMYAVYQIQPTSPKAKIRLTPQQWDDALHFQQQAKNQSHLDVVYIFNKLIEEQAFQFCFLPQEIGVFSWDCEDAEVDLADEMKEERCNINKLFNYESLEQLSYLQDQYQRMKVVLAGPHATKPDKSLNVVKEKLVEDIVLSLQTFKENVANMSKRVGNSTKKAERELKTGPQTVGSRRQALKNAAFAGSPSTRSRRLSSESPEKNLAIDRANRAAQRALAKANAGGDLADDAELAMSDASLTSPTRLQADVSSPPSSRKKNLSMPVVVSDDGELSSGDGSDVEYVPPCKKSRGRKSMPQKIASRKSLQLIKAKSSSQFDRSPTKFGKTTSSQIATSLKHQMKESAKAASLSPDSHPASGTASSKETVTANIRKKKGDLKGKSDSSAKDVSEKTGFRITWNPVTNLRTREASTATGTMTKRGRPGKYSKASNDSREDLETDISDHDKSSTLDLSESETSLPPLPDKRNKNKQVRRLNNEKTSAKPSLGKGKVNVSRDQTESESMNDSPTKKVRDKTKGAQSGKKDTQKALSSYEVVMAPSSRAVQFNIFDNARFSKTLKLTPESTGENRFLPQ